MLSAISVRVRLEQVKVGVELKDEELPDKFSGDFIVLAFERWYLYTSINKSDLIHWLSHLKISLRFSAGRYIYDPNEDEDVLWERFSLLPDCMEALTVKIHANDLAAGHLDSIFKTLRANCKSWSQSQGRRLQLNFDLSDESQILGLIRQWTEDRVGYRMDPLWDGSSDLLSGANEWGIQGKHLQRWVRYYSNEQLENLAEQALRCGAPLHLYFSHSQRWLQYRQFLEILHQKLLEN